MESQIPIPDYNVEDLYIVPEWPKISDVVESTESSSFKSESLGSESESTRLESESTGSRVRVNGLSVQVPVQ